MSSISSVNKPQVAPAPAKTQAPEASKGVRDTKNDGDRDDGAAPAQAANAAAKTSPAPKPVTNTMGQLIGKTLDVQA